MDEEKVIYIYYNGIFCSLENGLLSHATTCLILNNIMLSEQASRKKTNTARFYCYEESNIAKTRETEKGRMVS